MQVPPAAEWITTHAARMLPTTGIQSNHWTQPEPGAVYLTPGHPAHACCMHPTHACYMHEARGNGLQDSRTSPGTELHSLSSILRAAQAAPCEALPIIVGPVPAEQSSVNPASCYGVLSQLQPARVQAPAHAAPQHSSTCSTAAHGKSMHMASDAPLPD